MFQSGQLSALGVLNPNWDPWLGQFWIMANFPPPETPVIGHDPEGQTVGPDALQDVPEHDSLDQHRFIYGAENQVCFKKADMKQILRIHLKV